MKEWKRERNQKQKRDEETSGSITVFLSILFLLFFSLIGVTFENARVLSSEGYLRTAAHAAAMTVFGNYNKELFEQYGLFAYGGYDGKGAEDLAEEFQEILTDNLQTAPEKAKLSYTDFYRFGKVEGQVEDVSCLTEQEIFYGQIKAYLKSQAVEDIKELLSKKMSGDTADDVMEEKLALTKDYEDGKFDETDEEEGEEGAGETTAQEITEEDDCAGGNPLEIFSDLARDGILNLVCDASRLSDGVVKAVEQTEAEKETEASEKKDWGAADYLKELMGKDSEQPDASLLEQGAEKLAYIAYADKQFSSYTDDKKRTTKYGMEYLAAGKQEEKDNIAFVVNRLLVMRMLVNFVTIFSDAVLQEKSLATATVLAGFTGIPPVIQAVQYVILLILAFEEACVDVMALLEGRSVPFIKSAANLKMAYEEICLASKTLFSSKAESYPKEGKSAADISYQQYLYLLLLTTSKKCLRERSYDLIQYDLRERYNQTFTIKNCICKSTYSVSCQIPYLFENLPFLTMPGEGEENTRELEVNYEYRSR